MFEPTSGVDITVVKEYVSGVKVCLLLCLQASSEESVQQRISCKLWSLAREKLNVANPDIAESLKLPEVSFVTNN